MVFSFVIFKLRCIARAKRRGDLTSTRAAQRLAIKNFKLGPQSSLQIFNLAKQVSRHVWQVRAGRAPPGYLASMAPEPHPSPAGWPQNRTKRRYSPRTARGQSLYYVAPHLRAAFRAPSPAPCGAAYPYFPHRTYRPYRPRPCPAPAPPLQCGPQPCGLAPRILRDLFSRCAAGSPHPLRDLFGFWLRGLAHTTVKVWWAKPAWCAALGIPAGHNYTTASILSPIPHGCRAYLRGIIRNLQ